MCADKHTQYHSQRDTTHTLLHCLLAVGELHGSSVLPWPCIVPAAAAGHECEGQTGTASLLFHFIVTVLSTAFTALPCLCVHHITSATIYCTQPEVSFGTGVVSMGGRTRGQDDHKGKQNSKEFSGCTKECQACLFSE